MQGGIIYKSIFCIVCVNWFCLIFSTSLTATNLAAATISNSIVISFSRKGSGFVDAVYNLNHCKVVIRNNRLWVGANEIINLQAWQAIEVIQQQTSLQLKLVKKVIKNDEIVNKVTELNVKNC